MRTVCGFGYKPTEYPSQNPDGTYIRSYACWSNMIKRCYGSTHKTDKQAYINCTVDQEWSNYVNFLEWFHSQPNYQLYEQESDYTIDKDILYRGNQVYGPETCTLVPGYLNSFLRECKKTRGKYPIGVTKKRKTNLYCAECSFRGNTILCKYTSTPEAAFQIYKGTKEQKIKEIAEYEYKDKRITKQCYEALMHWEILNDC